MKGRKKGNSMREGELITAVVSKTYQADTMSTEMQQKKTAVSACYIVDLYLD